MKSRRDFLKIAGLSAFALGTASALTLATGSKASALPAGTAPAKGSYTNEPDALHAKRWAMVIDTRKFTSPEHFQRGELAGVDDQRVHVRQCARNG